MENRRRIKTFELSLISLITLTIFLFGAGKVEAHPGRTASDGCHYCRTNCDYWGVPWDERHCHGGPVLPQTTTQPYVPPTTPKSTISPTPAPTPTLTPQPIETPTPEPEVRGETTQLSPSPVAVEGTQTERSGAGALVGLAVLAVIGGGAVWIFRGLWRRLRGPTTQQDQ